MSPDEDVFEKLDALLRKHHPTPASPAASGVSSPSGKEKKHNEPPLLTELATPSIMALPPRERAQIPILTEVVDLAVARAESEPDVESEPDLDKEFELDLSALKLTEATETQTVSEGESWAEPETPEEELSQESVVGSGIEVPQEEPEIFLPPATESEIIYLPSPIDEVSNDLDFELGEDSTIDFEPAADNVFADEPLSQTWEQAPASENALDLTAATSLNSSPDEVTPAEEAEAVETETLQAEAVSNEQADGVSQETPDEAAETVPAYAIPSETLIPDQTEPSTEDTMLIFDDMDKLPPKDIDFASMALKDIDKHLQRLVEEKIGPQLTLTMDRALATMLDQFSTHIEYLVRESVALELQKQLEALRATFAQQLSVYKSNLEQTDPDKKP